MKTLFDQTRMGNMTLKNRLIRSATGDRAVDGHLTQEVLNVYENLAKGGVGTIITGFAKVVDSENPFPGMLNMSDDSFINEYRQLTDMVHNYGTNIILQVVYCGSFAMTDTTGREVLGPSAVENLLTKVVPKEMTMEEILFMQQAFADAAFRAKQAGFDGVQIHGAHGFLLSQFLSPYYNRRTDQYGGTAEKRARMVVETYEKVREMVGAQFPILIKINCNDGMEQGISLEDCNDVCQELSWLGIDAIEISGNWMQFQAKEQSYFIDAAKEIAAETNAPIILVGGNRVYSSMDRTLNETSIEYFSFSRPFIAEPDFVKRWQNGDTRIPKCISCNACATLDNMGKCILNK